MLMPGYFGLTPALLWTNNGYDYGFSKKVPFRRTFWLAVIVACCRHWLFWPQTAGIVALIQWTVFREWEFIPVRT